MSQFTRQTAGTCWFHTTMNGFLHSLYGRAYLIHHLYKQKTIKMPTNNSCPTKSSLLGYIKKYLSTTNLKIYPNNNNKKLNRMAYMTSSLTKGVKNTQKNISLFSCKTINSGGSPAETIKIYKNIFGC